MKDYLFTSESVSEGHPDKVCDQIADALVDTYLAAEPQARCGIEVLVTTNFVLMGGEVRGPASITKEQRIEVARKVIRDIGYEQAGFHWQNAEIECRIHGQSTDIALGVDAAPDKDEGAGDQGMMFGYACKETPDFMPAPIYYSHALLRSLSAARHAGNTPLLGPDSKSQVTARYIDGKPVGVEKLVTSIQHADGLTPRDVREIIRPYVAGVFPDGWMCDDRTFLVNPTGRFVTGGPDGDAGVTNRKIIVDTYGGAAPHGGGGFSGKDPTKVDRSGQYVSRWMAKNVVAADLADRCTIQIAYAIGGSRPLSFNLTTHGADVDEAKLARVLQEMVDLSPRAIRMRLGLNKPIYLRTAAYGHFGRTPDADGGFSWERLDLMDELRRAF